MEFLDVLAEYLLAKGCNVSPFTVETFLSKHSSSVPLDTVTTHPHIKKTRLGFYVHLFVLKSQRLAEILQKQISIHLDTFDKTAVFHAFLKEHAKQYNMFVYTNTKKTKTFVKLQTPYNIFNMQSLLLIAEQAGIAGLDIENVYSEYEAAYNDIAGLVEQNVLLRTKTRLYSAALAVPNV